ncbi:MAG: hypothetical protein KDN05_13630, partial [Verrucomicrobiae bacterium]|nr:hypothetical protein [Verrucomicrobiae bacterium]
MLDYTWPASSVVVQQGSLALERDNAIVSNLGPSSRPGLHLRNGTTLDVGSHSLALGTIQIDQGGQVLGTGTLSGAELITGNIPNFSAPGGIVTIDSNLTLGRLTESVNSTGLVINGDTTFTNDSYSPSFVIVRKQMDFQGAVDFGKRSVLSLSGTGTKSVGFADSVTSQELNISASGGGTTTLGVTFDDTLAASGLFITADSSADIRFNDVVTFSPTADITSPVFQLNKGAATLGGGNGSLVGMDNVNLGATSGTAPFRNATSLILDNGSFANNDRIDDSAAINIESGSVLTLIGNSIADVTEVLGTVNLGAGDTAFHLQNDPSHSTVLQITGLNRTADNVMLVNSSGGILGASGNTPRLLIDNASAGFLGQTIVNGTSFAEYSETNGVSAVSSVASANGALASDHVALTSSESVLAPTSFQSLAVGAGSALSGADLQISTGHILLQNGSSVSNIIQTPGDAFVYSNGNASLGGSVVVGGDFRKAGAGTLSVQSLVFGSGATVFVDSGTLATTADNAISSGTHMNVRAATFELGHNVTLGNVSLSGGADIFGSGTLSADNLTVNNSIAGRFSNDQTSTIGVSISGATNVAFVGGTNLLHGTSDYTGTTSIDSGALYLRSSGGAILSSSVIEIGKNSPKSHSSLSIQWNTGDRIGNNTAIDFHNSSTFFIQDYSGTEQVGDVSVFDKARVYLGTYTDSNAVLHMNSFTSNGGLTTLSSGNNGNFRADAVTIDGVAINDGGIVPTMFRNNSPVEWVSGNLRAVTPLTWSSGSSVPSGSFVTVTSAFSLATSANVQYIRFESADPFNSTPGTTLFVQSGLFFSAPGGNTMNADVSIGANGSVSTSSIARFTEQLTAAGHLQVIGGGATVIDGSATVTGLTSVKEGKLVVGENNSAAAFNGDIAVSGGAGIGGSGTITGELHILAGGKTQPGNSPGTLNITGDLIYDAQSIAEFELAQIGSSDLISIDGNLLFNGEMDLQLFALAGVTTGTYTLFEYTGSLTGFDNINIDSSVGLASNLGFSANLLNDTLGKSIKLNILSLGAT